MTSLNRKQADRLLSRLFIKRQSKGDHCHYYDDRGVCVFRLATRGRSNGVSLPPHVSKQVLKLVKESAANA